MPEFDIDFEAVSFWWMAVILPVSYKLSAWVTSWMDRRFRRKVLLVTRQAIRPNAVGVAAKEDERNDDDLIRLINDLIKQHAIRADSEKLAKDAFLENLNSAESISLLNKIAVEPAATHLAEVESNLNEKIRDVQKDFRTLSSQLGEFISNYYSKLESFLIKATGGN